MNNLFCNCNKYKNICLIVFDDKCNSLSGVKIFLRNLKTNNVSSFITSENGTVFIKNILIGKYELITNKEGFRPKKIVIDTELYSKFTLKLKKCNLNKISGYIKDSSNKKIRNATVVLYLVKDELNYKPFKSTKSDNCGFYEFKNIPKGHYIIKAIK